MSWLADLLSGRTPPRAIEVESRSRQRPRTRRRPARARQPTRTPTHPRACFAVGGAWQQYCMPAQPPGEGLTAGLSPGGDRCQALAWLTREDIMRRVWSVAALTATLTAMGGGVAVAQEVADGSSNRADLLSGINCRMRQSPTGEPHIISNDSRAVITSSGEINLVCHAEVPAGSVVPFTQSGFACNLAGMPATTSHVVWTPSGQGTLTCRGKFS